jgi:hypothetical protein
VACTDPTPFREKLVASAIPEPHFVLVWNCKDPMRPEYVLQAPAEVCAFQINAGNPMCIAAGCHDGRVLLWDCTAQEVTAFPVVVAGLLCTAHAVPMYHRRCADLSYVPI